MGLKEVWQLVKESISAWSDDYASSMGAALSYYTVFSISPLLLIVISVAGLVFGRDAAQGQIVTQLQGLIGQEGAAAVQGLLKSVSDPVHGLIATVVSVVTLVIGATSVFAELQSDMDRIWRAPPPEGSGVWHLLRTRLLSFGVVLGLAFLLLVSLVVSAVLAALGAWFGSVFGGKEVLLQWLNFFVSLLFVTGMFGMIYKFLPRVKIDWRDVWIGAAVTAVLFGIGKYLIGLYLGTSGVTSGFGAAGSLVVLLVWVYYSAQIFLLGAEFTRAYAHRHGSKVGEVAATAPAGKVDGDRAGHVAPPARPPPGRPRAVSAAVRATPAETSQAALAAHSSPGVSDWRARPHSVRQPSPGEIRRPMKSLGLLALGAIVLSSFIRSSSRSTERGFARRTPSSSRR